MKVLLRWLLGLNYEGTGDFAAQKLDLDTKTTAKFLSLNLDKVN
jgi:hypothetical protein